MSKHQHPGLLNGLPLFLRGGDTGAGGCGGGGSGEHILGGRPLLFLGGEGVAGGGVNTIEGEVTH